MLPQTTKMTPIRWRAAVRQLKGHSPSLLAARTQSSVPTGSRAYFRPRTALVESRRVHVLQSRVSGLARLQHLEARHFSSLLKRYGNGNGNKSYSSLPSLPPTAGPILQSAFPTKTFVALLLLGSLVYWAVEIEERTWYDSVLETFAGDHGATPLHFYKDRDDADHWITHHIPDASGPLRDPVVLGQINERFWKAAGGWEMSEEESVESGLPVTHGCRFRSNEPCEDYFALGTSPGPGSKPWNYWSIFDGHAGRHTALHLQWTLLPTLSRALSNLSPAAPSSTITATIKSVFLAIDNDIMTRARHAANWYPAANGAAIAALTPAFSGSCALLAAFDPEADKLRVACVGDSRAVLGRWDELEGKYIAKPLSVDQTGFNAAEVKRITTAHPDEPDILDPKSGRLLGLAVTRAFGDHRWKWDNDFVKALQLKFWGTAPRPNSKTPPYMDAEPEITETAVVRVDPGDPRGGAGKSDFLIMASDGLWDRISSVHAVECVQRWLEAKGRSPDGRVSTDPQLAKPLFGSSLSLDEGVEFSVENGEEVSWKATPEYFAIEDDNAAVCLARNAMGGTRRGLFIGLLSIPGPLSRMAVDDTTVMVVFFDKVGKGDGKGGGGGKEKKKSIWWPW
ncbi:protein serine/threonine phosphatase 2C [Lentithecium fluviatile CBS 122367]|uniref:Protein serine/threonine phosphatase 2C n=1 Tax=Lentithecium fluviatile CBS 122367 TaxID=1168545 RepID=A0A6G1IGB4_9PLEO|nr:protein serine/threonine phosphatase 2C [Lentithecium fluviatile CBS 122367]